MESSGRPVWPHAGELTGRSAECGVLAQLAEDVRAGASRALVVHGEAGVGKTALLDYVADHASGCRVVRAAGVQSEMELPFAGLHQLCAALLDRVQAMPLPQGEALRVAFGMSAGPPPDRFLLGLAVLSLLSAAAEEQPLMCLIDDAQWLDHASAQVLAFVARRLGSESIGLVYAARDPGGDLAGLPELQVGGLTPADARALLDSVLTGSIDVQVRDQIVAETRGNPLALIELPRGFTVAELAGGFGLPGALPISGSIEDSFRRRVTALSHRSRGLLLLAAADPTGDPALVWQAASVLGIGTEEAAPVADSGLAEFGTRIRFRHPLARSAAYRSAAAPERRAAHRALAEVTDSGFDPDRRAWHLAQAAPGPDDDIAAELERSAGRAQARGGLGAAAAFRKQATTLTLDPAHRARRALAAAEAAISAGGLEDARDLLAMAESLPLSDRQQASVDVLRAQLAFVTSRGGEAPVLLLTAARRLEAIDTDLARATYLDALLAAIFASRLAAAGGQVLDVARAASAAPSAARDGRVSDLLLDGTAAGLDRGLAAGLPVLRQALASFGRGMSAEEELRRMYLACITAIRIWDDERWAVLSARYVELARAAGALSELPLALTVHAYVLMFAGELAPAASLIDELQAVKDATGSGLASYGALCLAALRGDEAGAAVLVAGTIEDVARRGEGIGIIFAEWAHAMLHNGLGQYDKALAAGRRAVGFGQDPGALCWTLVELIEAAARCGAAQTAADACDQLAEMASACGTDWVRGVQARSRALLSEDDEAEDFYREAIACLGKTLLRVDLARAHLVYGEWLRRQRRRAQAREQLHIAHNMLDAMGIAGFAERARRELEATGETARRRTLADGQEHLTAQEAQIARLARDGLSNPEIATRLFISAYTVQYHLRKVFTKLGISSRSQLDRVLPSR